MRAQGQTETLRLSTGSWTFKARQTSGEGRSPTKKTQIVYFRSFGSLLVGVVQLPIEQDQPAAAKPAEIQCGRTMNLDLYD